MRKLFLALFVLCSFFASAQKIQKVNTYGYEYNRFIADTLFALPGDTFAVPAAYQAYPFLARKATTLYVWNTSTFIWQALAGGSGSGWELTGNSGTTPGTNFIGTTDDKSFVFKVKDSIAGVIQKRMSGAYSIGSVAFGMGALKNSYLSESYANTAIGSGALMEFIGAGGSQGATTAVGRGAGRDNKYGYRNTFIGEYSGFQGWGGDHNTYVGVFSGEVSSGGVFNAGFGGEAMRGQKQGSYNTGAGGYTLYRNTTIVDSVTITNGGSGYTSASCSFSSPELASPGTSSVVATGTVTLDAGVVTGIVITEHGSGYSNEKSTVTVTITGDGSNAAGTVVLRSSVQNSASGWAAGWQDYSGKNNTYNGAFSGGSIKNYYDEYNTYLGAYSIRNPAVPSTTKIEKGTAIGYNSILSQSNTVIIGDSINAKVGIGTTTPSHKLHVVGDFKLVDGTQGLNKVLTSDANGGASWQTASTPTLQQVLTAGSTLTQNNTINSGGFTLNVTGTTNNPFAIATTTGTGVYSTASGIGTSIYGSSSGGIGVYGLSSSSIGVQGQTITGTTAAQFTSSSTGTTDQTNIVQLTRAGNGTAANGFGTAIKYTLETSPGFYAFESNRLISKWVDVDSATRTSHFDITGVNNAAEETFANFQPGGIVRVNNLADTLAKKSDIRWTGTLATFGAGAGLSTDTAAFQTTSIYGSFYNDGNDTLIITKQMGILKGSSPSITPIIYWNDSLDVTAGATKLINSPSALTNTATGTAVTSFDNYKIPPGVWVWVATPTVGTKPTYFSLSLIGYKKRVI